MAVYRLFSTDFPESGGRANIAATPNDLFLDDTTGSILYVASDKTIKETVIGSGIKGFASGYVDAGTFVTLDNLKFSVTTGGQRGLCCATVSGTATLSISAHYAMVGGVSGSATTYPGANYTTTPSGSWFGWSFPNAGDASTYLINDYTNKRFYRVHLMIGAGYFGNFISIERLG